MKALFLALSSIAAVTFAAAPALADLNLTEPNTPSGGCGGDSLSLTQSNNCSIEIRIINETSGRIYYDFGSLEDQYLEPGASITWTLNSDPNYRSVKFDYNLLSSGIQLETYRLEAGNEYTFRRVDNRYIDMYRTGTID